MDRSLDLGCDPLGFGSLLIEHVGLDPTFVIGGRDRTGSARKVAGRHDVEGSLEDGFWHAKALVEHDSGGPGVPGHEVGDVPDLCATEGVDRLVGISGDREIPVDSQ